jgi:AraC-like DNA-binding protein
LACPVRLERSCPDERGTAPGGPANPIERLRIRMHGAGYSMHRHECYAVGLTLAGVQAFWFRGERRRSLPGQVLVIHPDERHDGCNGDEATLEYLMLYVAPAALASASERGVRAPLPFIPDAVRRSARLGRVISEAFADFPTALGELAEADLLVRLADALGREAGPAGEEHRPVDRRATALARNLLDAQFGERITAGSLESATGRSRYALARQFRAAYGTSPHQYLLGRRLRAARGLIGSGAGLAETALLCGFADQSHLTRHFRRWMGLTPGQFRSQCKAGEMVLGG